MSPNLKRCCEWPLAEGEASESASINSGTDQLDEQSGKVRPRAQPLSTKLGQGQLPKIALKRALMLVCVLAMLCPRAVRAQVRDLEGSSTNHYYDLVLFLKDSLSVPREVEHFVATHQRIKQSDTNKSVRRSYEPQTFEGARAGSNFWLRPISGKSPMHPVWTGMVAGQVGDNSYQANSSTLTFTREPVGPNSANPISAYSAGYRSIVNQFLDFGFGDLRAESLQWHSDVFSGETLGGRRIRGTLQHSNGIPRSVQIADQDTEVLYKRVTYEYPIAQESLAGFPFKILISTMENGILKSNVAITIHEVRLANKPLAASAFEPVQLIATSVIHTNEYSAGVRYSLDSGTRKPIRSASGFRSGIVSSSAIIRRIVLGVFAVTTIIFLLFVLQGMRRRRTTNSK